MDLIDRMTWNRSRRIQEMQSFAYDIAWDFTEAGDESIVKQLKQFKLFQQGGSKKIKPLLSLQQEFDRYRLFDYQYTISTGKSAHTYRQTVFFLESKMLSLPEFYQKPELFFDKLLRFFGIEDIDFHQHPEYSEKYHLKGEYEQIVRYYFTDDVLKSLTTQNKIYMEGMNYYFLMYHKSKIIPSPALKSFLNFCMLMSKLFLDRSEQATQFLQNK